MSLLAHYEVLLEDRRVFEERNFVRRLEAIEVLEDVLVAAGDAMAAEGWDSVASAELDPHAAAGLDSLEAEGWDSMVAEAARVKAALEEVDERLFARLRAEIAAGRHRGEAFRELILEFCGGDATDVGPAAADAAWYDTLDVFVNRLCSFLPMPSPIQTLEAEMVEYHKTPARVVLELARRIAPGDVFVDIGAGLGQAVLLVHLLTGAAAIGVEIESAFCRYARDCAAELGLSITFVEGDARFADHSKGTFFFLYTPFTGELLEQVFGLLRQQSLSRTFTLLTYGPCTMAAARQSWLLADQCVAMNTEFAVAGFVPSVSM